MDNAMTSTTMQTSLFSLGLVIDVLGILAGIFATFVVLKALSRIKGQVGSAFAFTLIGVLSQTLALIESLLTEDLKVFQMPNFGNLLQGHQVHELLMVIGMLFFVLGAKKFSDLSS